MSAMTSSGDLMFMEKANVVSAFAPEYHTGVQGEWRSAHLATAAGVYFRRINGSKEKTILKPIIKKARRSDIIYGARAVWMPLSQGQDQRFHFGHSRIAPRKQQGSLMPNTVRYSTTSLSYINKIKF